MPLYKADKHGFSQMGSGRKRDDSAGILAYEGSPWDSSNIKREMALVA
jgi:hypothetical protein